MRFFSFFLCIVFSLSFDYFLRIYYIYNMVKKQSIQDFENMKLGMFIHFGLYSQVGKGE